jgi:hypothetical protein
VVDFESTYLYSGCTTSGVEIPSEYILNECPEH